MWLRRWEETSGPFQPCVQEVTEVCLNCLLDSKAHALIGHTTVCFKFPWETQLTSSQRKVMICVIPSGRRSSPPSHHETGVLCICFSCCSQVPVKDLFFPQWRTSQSTRTLTSVLPAAWTKLSLPCSSLNLSGPKQIVGFAKCLFCFKKKKNTVTTV